jgi:hypothetical protein
MPSVGNRRAEVTRRAAVIVGAVALVGSIAATSYAPGYTYRIRLQTANTGFTLPGGNPPGGGGGGGAGPGGGGGGGGGGTFYLARGHVVGNKGRFQITSTSEGGGGPGGRGGGGGGGATSLMDQWFLVLDTNKVVTVNEANKTYTETDAIRGLAAVTGGVGAGRGGGRGPGAFGGDSTGRGRGGDSAQGRGRGDTTAAGRGRGRAGAGNAGGGGGGGGRGGGRGGGGDNPGGGPGGGGRGDASALTLTAVTVSLEKVPTAAGDTVDGYVTRHYKIHSQFTVIPITDPVTVRSMVEIWTADLPFKLINPFDQTLNDAPGQENLRELQIKQQAVRRQIQGTPIKIITTTPIGGLLGGVFGRGGRGGPPPAANIADTLGFSGATTTQTLRVYEIRATNVDDALLKIPDGFTRATGGRGPGGEER